MSYKNSLQSYCHRTNSHKNTPPVYSSQRASDGWRGVVQYGDTTVTCKQTSNTVKEADARAAFEALQKIGYLVEGAAFDMFIASKNSL